MTTYYFLCALPPEAAAAKAGLLLHERYRRDHAPAAASGASGASGHVRIVGMGPERARRACARLDSSLPEGAPVVVLGVGGALVGGLDPGDLVVANAVGFADMEPNGNELEVTRAPRPLDNRSEKLGVALVETLHHRFPSTRRGPVMTARRIARGAERAKLAQSGAVICDTESEPLMRLAERRPFAVVRAVVDSPDRELFSLSTVTGGAVGLKRLGDAAGMIAGLLERLSLASEHQNPSSQLMSPTQS